MSMKMKIYAAILKKYICKQLLVSPQTCTQHRCGQIVSVVCLPTGLLVCPWGPQKNHPWITMIQCLNVASKSEAEWRESRKKPARCACAHLFSVPQVLVLHVTQRLPVGVAATAAGFHLCQRLSLHRVTHLVVPVSKKKEKDELSRLVWGYKFTTSFLNGAVIKTTAGDYDSATRVLTGLLWRTRSFERSNS